MPLYDLLLPEFDEEIQKTRTTLERVPEDKPDFKPHEKSMAMVKLANHTAALPGFMSLMLTTDAFDVAAPGERPAPPETSAERLAGFDAVAKTARAQLAAAADRTLHENWKLSAGERVIFTGSRYHAIRSMFFNHMIHHRAQLGVYLRMNDCLVPSIYGPSADEK
jgi:uncharacterized damage-inducible protein DinB